MVVDMTGKEYNNILVIFVPLAVFLK